MYLVLLTLIGILLLKNQSASLVSSVLTLVRRVYTLELKLSPVMLSVKRKDP
jgi:hypothetical protein